MQEGFCYVQSASRLASQTSQDNWVSVSERFPQQKGFQELPGRRGRAHIPPTPYQCPVFTAGALWGLPPTVPETVGAARPSHSPTCGYSPARSFLGPAFQRQAPAGTLCSQPRYQGLGHWDPAQRDHSEGRTPGAPWSCGASLQGFGRPTLSRQKQAVLQRLGTVGLSWGGDRQTTAGCGNSQQGQAAGQLCRLCAHMNNREHSAAA